MFEEFDYKAMSYMVLKDDIPTNDSCEKSKGMKIDLSPLPLTENMAEIELALRNLEKSTRFDNQRASITPKSKSRSKLAHLSVHFEPQIAHSIDAPKPNIGVNSAQYKTQEQTSEKDLDEIMFLIQGTNKYDNQTAEFKGKLSSNVPTNTYFNMEAPQGQDEGSILLETELHSAIDDKGRDLNKIVDLLSSSKKYENQSAEFKLKVETRNQIKQKAIEDQDVDELLKSPTTPTEMKSVGSGVIKEKHRHRSISAYNPRNPKEIENILDMIDKRPDYEDQSAIFTNTQPTLKTITEAETVANSMPSNRHRNQEADFKFRRRTVSDFTKYYEFPRIETELENENIKPSSETWKKLKGTFHAAFNSQKADREGSASSMRSLMHRSNSISSSIISPTYSAVSLELPVQTPSTMQQAEYSLGDINDWAETPKQNSEMNINLTGGNDRHSLMGDREFQTVYESDSSDSDISIKETWI